MEDVIAVIVGDSTYPRGYRVVAGTDHDRVLVPVAGPLALFA